MKKGFTLIELLIVVAILGIVSAVGISSYTGMLKSARINAVKTQHRTITQLMEGEAFKCLVLGEEFILGDVACSVMNNSSTPGDIYAKNLGNNIASYAEETGWKNPYNNEQSSIIFVSGDSPASPENGATYIIYNSVDKMSARIESYWEDSGYMESDISLNF
jgi:type IV pilus assembly protein PilA